MSYTYLLEQGEESSAESFADIPAFVLSRLNLIAGKSCCKGSGTESCQDSPSGMMSPPSTANRGEEELMSCAAASPARTYLPLEKAQESTGQGLDYGPRWQGSVARWNPATSSWKTRQCSLFGGLESFWGTWPDWGMMQDGEFWDMTTAEGNTRGKESGLLPTVTKEIFANWASAEGKINNGGKRKSGVKIGSIFWWTMTEMHLRLGGARESGMYPDPSCGEMLMGWVDSWTELTPLEMDKFQQWLHSHGEF
jgi:hypothetical protein